VKIKEQNEQRMVIAPTLYTMLYATLKWNNLMWPLVIFFIVFACLMSSHYPAAITILVVIGLFYLGELTSHKVVLDKSNNSIMAEWRYFLLFHRKLVVPLSALRKVEVSTEKVYDDYPGQLRISSRTEYEVSIKTTENNITISRTYNKKNMEHLASEIIKFIRK